MTSRHAADYSPFPPSPPDAAAVQAGESVAAFNFPIIDTSSASTTVGGGVIAVAAADRPEVRAVMKALASSEFGLEMPRRGGWILPHQVFDLGNPNKTDRGIASLTRQALETDGFRFDAFGLMPPGIGTPVQFVDVHLCVEGRVEVVDEMLRVPPSPLRIDPPGGLMVGSGDSHHRVDDLVEAIRVSHPAHVARAVGARADVTGLKIQR